MSLNIHVNDTYKLTSDSLQVIVQRKHLVDPTKSPNWPTMKAKGHDGSIRTDWKDVAHCTTVEKALNYIVEQTQRDSNAGTLSELLKDITAIRREISALLSPEGVR